MSSRSSGVMKLRSSRMFNSRITASASCSAFLISATKWSSRSGVANISWSSSAATFIFAASWLNRMKKPWSRGMRPTNFGLESFVTTRHGCVTGGQKYPPLTRAGNSAEVPPRYGCPMRAQSGRHEHVAGVGHCEAPAVQIGVYEQLHQDDSGDESPDMRPHRDASRHLGIHGHELRQPRDHLPEKPPEQDRPGRNSKNANEQQEPEQHPDSNVGIQDEVGSEDARDRSRCTHGRDGRRRIQQNM